MPEKLIGVLNADMFGMKSEPGEYVDWSAPDFNTESEWLDQLGHTVEWLAEHSYPHLIVFEV